MPTIMDFYNTGQQARTNQIQNKYLDPMLAAQLYTQQNNNKYLDEKNRLANQYSGLVNSYYGPEHQAAIDYQNIINKYQPEKSRLGNENQALVNKYYAPNIQSEINARDAETQFTPLKYAIQAENSIRNNSRFGGSYQYLKSVADLPAEQRSVFLGNPDNYQQYMDMIQQLHGSVSSGQGSSSLITPALLKRVGLETLSQDIVGAPAPKGVVVSSSQTGGIAAPMGGGAPQTPAMMNAPQNVSQPPAMQGGMGGGMAAPMGQAPSPMGAPPMGQGTPPMGGGMAGGMAAPMMPPQGGQMVQPQGSIPALGAPQGLPPAAPPLTPQAAQVASTAGISPSEGNEAANDAKNPSLTPQQKQLLGFQMTANKKLVGQYITNRALGAVTFEKVLGENQDKFAPAFENAAKYAGLMGQGQLKIDQFRKDHPQEYADYMWVTTDLVPNFGQNIRVMEGLASTDNQREALKEMYTSSLNWKSDPKLAVKNINRTIDLFQSQAKAAMETAQPQYPGVLEKMYGLGQRSGDYIGPGRTGGKKDIKQVSTEDLLKMYQGGQ